MRYLAIDIGDKRTGLALGDDETRVVAPVGVIERPMDERDGEALLDELVSAIEANLGKLRTDGDASRASRSAWSTSAGGGELVIGLPINMDGSEGPAAQKARAFGGRLAARSGRAVHFQDERLTSVDADWAMSRSGLTRRQKKERRDALAASAILRDFLAAKADPQE